MLLNYRVSQKVANRMRLTGILCLEIVFGRFLPRPRRIKCSQVMSMGKFGPTALNFGRKHPVQSAQTLKQTSDPCVSKHYPIALTLSCKFSAKFKFFILFASIPSGKPQGMSSCRARELLSKIKFYFNFLQFICLDLV